MTRFEADRDLLFGILALQNGFIDQGALVAAFQAWAQNKERPIARILEERGDLAPSRAQLLDALVDEHIRQHENVPAQSLASVSSAESARAALKQLKDADLEQSLALVGRSKGDHADPFAVPESQPAEASDDDRSIGDTTAEFAQSDPLGGRFRVLRPHAEGGLGVVSVALDQELSRRVALKRIRDQHADRLDSRTRFMLEAEITGGLEHPGIVPVYSLGRDRDGRPFYAMRFVQGDSLKEAIALYHAHKDVHDDGWRTLELQKLLRRFLDVCEAIAYAHSRGVLHRDLKPGNIMMGRYGETLVVDWGLAKVVGAPEGSDERALRPSSSSGSSETLPGSAIGTPGYMSPEQADGRLEELGPVSDVYSLGATFYALLTGKNPVEGKDVGAILERVRRGDIKPPKQRALEVPAALDAICQKAMALKPADRYGSAKELAADIEAWLADEPVSAWNEPLPARARRWARRHQRTVSAAAATILVGFVSLMVLAVVISISNRRLDAANTRIQTQNERITEQNAQLEETNRNLEVARAEAERERDQAEAVTDFLVESFRSPDPERDGREITIAEVLDRAVEELKNRDTLSSIAAVRILDAIGKTYYGLGLIGEALASFRNAFDTCQERLAPEHPQALVSKRNLAVAYRDLGQYDQAAALLKPVLQAQRQLLGNTHPETLSTLQAIAITEWYQSQLDQALARLHKVFEARQSTLGRDDPDTISTQYTLGLVYRDSGEIGKAISLLEDVLQQRKRILGPGHPDTLSTQDELASTLIYASQFDKALPLLEEVIRSRDERLGSEHIATLNSRRKLAVVYQGLERYDEAIPLLEKTWTSLQAHYGDDQPDTLETRALLGVTLRNAGRVEDALPHLKQVLEARREHLGLEHIVTLNSQSDLAFAYIHLARSREAVELLEPTLESLRTNAGPKHPATLLAQHLLSQAYQNLGHLEQAISLFRSTLDTRRAVLGEQHSDTLLTAHLLARALMQAEDFKEAIQYFEFSYRGYEEIIGAHHSWTHFNQIGLGRAYELSGQLFRAEEIYRDVLHATQELDPPDPLRHSQTLVLLGSCLNQQGRFDEALPFIRESLEIRRRHQPSHWLTANARSLLGEALTGLEHFEEAEPLLLESQQRLVEQYTAIPVSDRERIARQAVERIIQLYEVWDKPDDAERWRRQLGPSEEPELPADVFARPPTGS